MIKKNCTCKGKAHKDPNCPACGDKGKLKWEGDDNGLLDCLDWSKLRSLLVFTAGSFLTMRLALVAAELG